MALFPLLHPNHDLEGYRSALWIPAHLTLHIGAISFLFALPAIYALQGERNGWLGLAGYVLATLGTAQLLMVAWVEFFAIPFFGLQGFDVEGTPPPGVEIAGPLMNLSLAVGYAVLGLGIVRAGVLPRAAGVLLVIAAPIFNLGGMLLGMLLGPAAPDLFTAGSVLFSLAMGWVGFGLWTAGGVRRTARAAETTAPVAAPALGVGARS